MKIDLSSDAQRLDDIDEKYIDLLLKQSGLRPSPSDQISQTELRFLRLTKTSGLLFLAGIALATSSVFAWDIFISSLPLYYYFLPTLFAPAIFLIILGFTPTPTLILPNHYLKYKRAWLIEKTDYLPLNKIQAIHTTPYPFSKGGNLTLTLEKSPKLTIKLVGLPHLQKIKEKILDLQKNPIKPGSQRD